MFGGVSMMSNGGDCLDQQVQTLVGFVAESQVPSFCSQVNLQNVPINEDISLSGCVDSKQRFSMDEDKLLMNAWLNVSKDPIVGVDQKGWLLVKDQKILWWKSC